jgi:hypothetical protein
MNHICWMTLYPVQALAKDAPRRIGGIDAIIREASSTEIKK